MAGPKQQVIGETIRPRFNVFTILDHALGSYVRGDDGMYYLNGGWAHIMVLSGRGNTFKTTLLDHAHSQIQLRYNAAWASKYDTEISAKLARVETGFRSALRANGIAYNEEAEIALHLIEQAAYNLAGSDVMPGEEWYANYMRDEVEGRFNDYVKGKGTRETPFPDPVRKRNRMMLDPWLFGLDSLSEWHTGTLEEKHASSDIGTKDQNILNANDALHKANMMSRRTLS